MKKRLSPVVLTLIAALLCIPAIANSQSAPYPFGLPVMPNKAREAMGIPTATPVVCASGTIDGQGDSVVRIPPRYRQCLAVGLGHTGKENFIVTANDYQGNYLELLVNDIGIYEGVSLWSRDYAILEIKADGQWVIVFGE